MASIRQHIENILQRARQQTHRGLPVWGLVAFLGLLFILMTASSGTFRTNQPESLFEGRRLSDEHIAKIVTAFETRELARFEVRGGQVLIPSGERATYLAALAAEGATPPGFQSFTKAAVAESRIFETERQREQRVSYAEERDLAEAIACMPGVERAMVKYDETAPRGFRAEKVQVALVTVLTSPDYLLGMDQVHSIRHMVANARAGLNPQDVCVTDLRRGWSSVGSGKADGHAVELPELIGVRRSLEADWQQKISELLNFVPGAQVFVRLDWQNEDQLNKQAKLVDSTRPAYKPRHVAVSVQVPRESYLDYDVADDESDGNSGDVQRPALDKLIESAIRSLFPNEGGVPASIQITEVVSPAPTRDADARIATLDAVLRRHYPALVLVALAGVVVGIVSWWRRPVGTPSQAPSGSPSQSTTHSQHPARDDSRHDATPIARPRDFATERDTIETGDDDLRGTLAEIVREDPDSAAEVLQDWLNRAG